MRKAIFERNAAFAEKKMASKTIRTTKKELADAKNKLSNAKKDVTIAKKDVDQLMRQNGKEVSQGDSIDHYRGEERIRLDTHSRRGLWLITGTRRKRMNGRRMPSKIM
jgi:hypothetical protein